MSTTNKPTGKLFTLAIVALICVFIGIFSNFLVLDYEYSIWGDYEYAFEFDEPEGITVAIALFSVAAAALLVAYAYLSKKGQGKILLTVAIFVLAFCMLLQFIEYHELGFADDMEDIGEDLGEMLEYVFEYNPGMGLYLIAMIVDGFIEMMSLVWMALLAIAGIMSLSNINKPAIAKLMMILSLIPVALKFFIVNPLSTLYILFELEAIPTQMLLSAVYCIGYLLMTIFVVKTVGAKKQEQVTESAEPATQE